jgi:hypothetical protein
MTTQEIFNWAASDPDNALTFIVTTHYDQVLARANNAGVVRGAVSLTELIDAVKRAKANPQLFAQLVDVTPDPSRMNAEAAEAFNMLMASKQPELRMQMQNVGGSGGASGSGASTGGSTFGGFWNADTTNAAVGTIPGIISAISCAVNPDTCRPSGTTPVVVQNPNTQQPPQTNWAAWAIGGAVLLVVLVVVVLVAVRIMKK